MANIKRKVPENAPGQWYVDKSCIICNLCEYTAPENFGCIPNGHYIAKQPESEVEKKLCQRAKKDCPVKAIGNDGPVTEEQESTTVSR